MGRDRHPRDGGRTRSNHHTSYFEIKVAAYLFSTVLTFVQKQGSKKDVLDTALHFLLRVKFQTALSLLGNR